MHSGNTVLDCCGGSGSWSLPYREAGYKVLNLTLPEFDVTELWFDDYSIRYTDKYGYNQCLVLYEDICGILAAPPCTEWSLAKGARPRDFAGAWKIVKACMDVIEHVQLYKLTHKQPPIFWALENPKAFLRQMLGKPQYTFEQWQFGGDFCKATDIWGYFNAPKPTHTVKPETAYNPSGHAKNWGKCKMPAEHRDYILSLPKAERRPALRAITPSGFANAFFKANNPLKMKGAT